VAGGDVRRLVASVLAWIVGAVTAVGVGILALSLIGDGLTTRTVQPLTPDVVAREASAVPVDPAPAPATPSSTPGDDDPSGSAPPSPPRSAPASATGQQASADKLLWSAGGSVIARCTGANVYLVSWSPEPGYRAHDVVRGPAAQASVRFDNDDDRVAVSVGCVSGTPVATVIRRGGDDHGHA
jgi:hypothetical protein